MLVNEHLDYNEYIVECFWMACSVIFNISAVFNGWLVQNVHKPSIGKGSIALDLAVLKLNILR